MKLLHTSDWHLGRSLHGRKRYDEFDLFLKWLVATLHQKQISVLLIAGDIFDTTTPSNRAQSQYYRFLCDVAASPCRHVVIIAGNHDSPTFLDAPRELLKALDVHVVGQPGTNPADEVLVLKSEEKQKELIVCAVPYLRDRDLRLSQIDQSLMEKDRLLIQGLHEHYRGVTHYAQTLRQRLGNNIPIVAMGHLFAAGGQTLEGDGVRELYVGNLAHIGADLFGPLPDYVALGHLHVPQTVAGRETIRYSGSPLPMGFGEARQQKSVCCVSFMEATPTIECLPLPVFQRLERIRGDWSTLEKRLQALRATGESVWLELIYDGNELMGDLRQRIENLVSGSKLDVLRISNLRVVDLALARTHETESLESLSADQVFERCLDAHDVSQEERAGLWDTYRQTLTSLQNDDPNAH